MCISKVLKLFKKPKPPVVLPEPPPLTIPHPEEPMNPDATIYNMNLEMVRQAWYQVWKVPTKSQAFFDKVILKLDPNFPYLAGTAGNEITFQPVWCNKGTMAHEMCHIAYALLTDKEKSDFEATFNTVKDEPIMKLVNFNRGMVENHADTYRYIGDNMPEVLKRFYRGLFND